LVICAGWEVLSNETDDDELTSRGIKKLTVRMDGIRKLMNCFFPDGARLRVSRIMMESCFHWLNSKDEQIKYIAHQ
jgi:hypothetical protein